MSSMLIILNWSLSRYLCTFWRYKFLRWMKNIIAVLSYKLWISDTKCFHSHHWYTSTSYCYENVYIYDSGVCNNNEFSVVAIHSFACLFCIQMSWTMPNVNPTFSQHKNTTYAVFACVTFEIIFPGISTCRHCCVLERTW